MRMGDPSSAIMTFLPLLVADDGEDALRWLDIPVSVRDQLPLTRSS